MSKTTIPSENAFDKTDNWFQLALVYFIVASILGVIMRYAFVGDLPEWIDFRNIRHAHSHVALLGWLHAGLFIFIVYTFKLKNKNYKHLYWLTQATIFGMLVSFPIQGYAGFSIGFVTLFIFLSYYFIVLVLKDLKQVPKDFATVFLKTALFFLFLSSLGTWGLAIIMNTSLKGGAVYYGAVQFYLHFQFNGWLIFGVLAILFKILSNRNIALDAVKIKWFYWLLLVSTCLTYAIAVTWSTPLAFIFWINSVGVLIQFTALILFIQIIRSITPKLKALFHKDIVILLSISLLSFIIKVVIQTAVVIPTIAKISYTVRNFVIGFIHLLMLGCLSLFFIALYQHYFQGNMRVSKGLQLFVVAIVLSEMLLFLQGLLLWAEQGFLPHYYLMIFILSALLPLGMIIYFFRLKTGLHKSED